ncbi:MAG: hypothetical protein M1813_002382 [Trichoglossum hirsutum]|nr:MAG: hypothetical protein M1813_002382 [Trichoglossum hirsutum]
MRPIACPHRGFHSVVDALAAISPRLSSYQPGPGLENELLRKSAFLEALEMDFRKLYRSHLILSYYTETEAACTTIGPLEITFPTESATLGMPGETAVAVAKDHFFICKYDNADDKLFTPLAPAIRRMVDTSPDREIGPRGTLRKPTTQRTPPAPKLEVDIRVSIIEFHRWQVTDDNSALTWGPVQPGDVQNIRLSDLIEHGPLTCVQMLRERGATDARSIRGLDGLQSRYEFRWIHVPGLVGSWAERVIRKVSEEMTDSTIANDLLADDLWAER